LNPLVKKREKTENIPINPGMRIDQNKIFPSQIEKYESERNRVLFVQFVERKRKNILTTK
jgi:hypothetical protein